VRGVKVLFARTFAGISSSKTTAFIASGFFVLYNVLFLNSLLSGEGSSTPIEVMWALSVSSALPVLCSLMTMRLWADERRTGMIDLLLVTPLPEKRLVFGKYLGVLMSVILIILISLVTPLYILPYFAPAIESSISFFTFIPAICILILHAMLWCSIGSWMSVLAKNSAIAAFVSFLLMAALPYIAYRALLEWLPALRAVIPEYPFFRSLSDFATGYISTASLVFYFAFTFFSLFAATKALAVLRLVGRGGRSTRFTAFLAVTCAFIFTVLSCACAVRFNVSVDLPFHSKDLEFSERTKSILSETAGNVSVTCFMSRRAPEFRTVSRLLRGLAAVAKASAGARVTVEFVDPRWDLGRAAHIVRQGVDEGSVIFSRARRRAVVPVSSLFIAPADSNDTAAVISPSGIFVGETVCASAIRKLSLPQRNEIVYWTTGHGEASFDNYDRVYGMSDIVRDLRQDGFLMKTLDLTTVPAVPEDCSILFVASARDAFSVTELSRIAGYLRKGGRLLVLTDERRDSGVGRLLSSWGVKVENFVAVSPVSITGADLVASHFADHVITRPLSGGALLFERAAVLSKSAAKGKLGESGDLMTFTPLVKTDASAWGESEPAKLPWTYDSSTEPAGPLTLATALERGGDISGSLAFRPSRIVVIGDPSFVMNGTLASRARANRDFFLNTVSWLAGVDATTAIGSPANVISLGMDRSKWIKYGFWSVCGMPLVILLLGVLGYLRRRYSE
jgi:hypothetical protein